MEDVEQKVEWRCFHCGDVFTREACARKHFGPDEGSVAACVIKAGSEQGLLGALRKAEGELADAWHAIHSESTDAAKAYYAQHSRHQEQMRLAEESGYEKGLADGRALTTPSAKLAEVERGIELATDMLRALPGGKMDDSTYEAIEEALDIAGAPCTDGGVWLNLVERVRALARPDLSNPTDVEQCVKPCPACEGEGEIADGLDDAAVSTCCPRCSGNGWLVNVAALPLTPSAAIERAGKDHGGVYGWHPGDDA